MNFNTPEFLIFLPAVLVLYAIFPKRKRWIPLLAASFFFYGSWNVELLWLFCAVILISYSSALLMERFPKRKRLLLLLTLVVCLGTLAYFKYFGFFANSVFALINAAAGSDFSFERDIILPVGISFYTFQTLSYVIDVYRGNSRAERHLGYYALFVSFFPQLVAGPIETPGRLLPQLKKEQNITYTNFTRGLRIMLRGFFKKCVVADVCAIFANEIFGNFNAYAGLPIAVGALVFFFQMYGDFSGYSDIAMGAARMMGVELSVNFDRPFLSQSYAEFFRRWHITLNRWFTSYVYIPLGGSRRGTAVKLRNTVIVFFLCGLWHGASWTYVLWGLYAAFFISVEELFRVWTGVRFADIKKDSRLMSALRIGLMFLTYVPSAIFFRSTSVSNSFAMIGRLFAGWCVFPEGILEPRLLAAIGAGLVSMFVLDGMNMEERGEDFREAAVDILLILAVAFSWIALLSGGDESSFAYFQF